jgi:hypothetical protein
MQPAVASLSGDLKPLVKARSASGHPAVRLARNGGNNTENLVKAYEKEIADQDVASFAAAIFGSLALLMLVLMVKAFNDEGTAPRQRSRPPAPHGGSGLGRDAGRHSCG